MALHRDIYWVGKQWAVTGHGIQACNQKQRSQFDIEGSRLWDEGVQDAVRAEKWVNADDFEKAVGVARKYFPEPQKGTPLEHPVSPTGQAAPPAVTQDPHLAMYQLRIERVPAKWLRVWRIRKGSTARPQ